MLRRLGLAALLVLAVGAVWLLRPAPEAPFPPGTPPHALPSVRSSIGTDEDPQARARWETMRLASPTTGAIPAGIREAELAFAAQFDAPAALAPGDLVTPWTIRGPGNVGGRTRALAYDTRDEATLLAAGISGGIYRSTDSGASWTLATALDDLPSITAIAQDPSAPDTWYAGTGEGRGNSASGGGAPYRGNGVYTSSDNGVTWSLLPATASNTPQDYDSVWDYVSEVAVGPSSGTLLAAASNGIERSTNGGASFTTVLAPGSRNSRLADVTFGPGGVAFAGIFEGGVYCSADDGATWSTVTPPSFPTAGSIGRVEIAVTPSNPNRVWVLAETAGAGTAGHSLARFTKTGACAGTWTDFSAALPARGGASGTFNSQGGYDLLVEVHPTDPDLVYVGGRNLWRLDVSGGASSATNTWIGGYTSSNASFALYPNQHPDQHTLVFLQSNPNAALSGNDGGVQRSNNVASGGDGATAWTPLNDGYYTTQAYKTCFNEGDPGDPTLVAGFQDNGTWSTGAPTAVTPWRSEFSGDGADCAVANNSSGGGTSRYVSFQNGGMYRLVYDATGNQTAFTRIDPQGATGYLFINPYELALNPTGTHTLFVPAGTALYRNTDVEAIPLFSNSQSTLWQELTGAATSGTITALEYVGNALFYGTSDGSVFRLDNARTSGPSASAVRLNPTLGFRNGGSYVSGIAVDPSDPNRVAIVFSNYDAVSVFYTLNALSAQPTWVDGAGNIEENPDGSGAGPSVRDIAFVDDDLVVIGTSTGIYTAPALTPTTQWTWVPDVGNVPVDDIDVRALSPTEAQVLAGSHGRGVYTATYDTGGAVSNETVEERGFALATPYPNPARGRLQSTLTVTRPQRVTVALYDSRGRRVGVLLDADVAAGQRQALEFDTGRLAAGAYLLQARGETFSQTRRVTVVR